MIQGHAYNTFPKMGDSWIPDDIFDMEPLIRNFFENTSTVQVTVFNAGSKFCCLCQYAERIFKVLLFTPQVFCQSTMVNFGQRQSYLELSVFAAQSSHSCNNHISVIWCFVVGCKENRDASCNPVIDWECIGNGRTSGNCLPYLKYHFGCRKSLKSNRIFLLMNYV